MVNASIRETLGEFFDAYPEIISDKNNFIFFNTKVNSFMQLRHTKKHRENEACGLSHYLVKPKIFTA